jgi:hypothetical protein
MLHGLEAIGSIRLALSENLLHGLPMLANRRELWAYGLGIRAHRQISSGASVERPAPWLESRTKRHPVSDEPKSIQIRFRLDQLNGCDFPVVTPGVWKRSADRPRQSVRCRRKETGVADGYR